MVESPTLEVFKGKIRRASLSAMAQLTERCSVTGRTQRSFPTQQKLLNQRVSSGVTASSPVPGPLPAGPTAASAASAALRRGRGRAHAPRRSNPGSQPAAGGAPGLTNHGAQAARGGYKRLRELGVREGVAGRRRCGSGARWRRGTTTASTSW